MILSRGDRDLWVAFQTHPGSQASSRVEAKNSALLSSCDGYLLEPTEWPKGSQASCGVLRKYSGLLSRPCRRRRASSHDDGGTSWFLTSCGEIFKLRRATQNLSCFPREVQSPFELREGVRDSSRVTAGQTDLI